ncbi:MAG: hypothetical protein LBU02_02280 [Rickettsiales bacterium]|nr:hypothetical protein [Rickettsiales bacterium]
MNRFLGKNLESLQRHEVHIVQKIKHETPSTLSFLSFYLHRLKINNSFILIIRVTAKVVK